MSIGSGSAAQAGGLLNKKLTQIRFGLYVTWDALGSLELIMLGVGVFLDTSAGHAETFPHFFFLTWNFVESNGGGVDGEEFPPLAPLSPHSEGA